MKRLRHCWRWGLVLAALVFCQAAPPSASAQEKPGDKGKEKEQERFAFEFRAKPWTGTNGVLEWLSDKTKLPVVTVHKPSGTVNYISPKTEDGKPAYKTIPEIIDILNDLLAEQQFILFRKTASITLLRTDQPFPEVDIPRLTVDELESRGRTELASVVLKLQSLDAEAFANEAKGLLGYFGKVTALPTGQMLVLRDQVGTLRAAIKVINELDKRDNTNLTFNYKCKYVKASEAAATVQKFLGDPKVILEFVNKKGEKVQRPREHTISWDDSLNTIIISGPLDKIAKAKDVLKEIDVGSDLYVVGKPFMQRLDVSTGNADILAKALKDIHKSSENLKIDNIGNTAIYVWASPNDQFLVAKTLAELMKNGGGSAKMIPLTYLEANKIVPTLEKMFPGPDKGGPYLEADNSRNAILVKGTAQHLTDIQQILNEFGEDPAQGTGRTRPSS